MYTSNFQFESVYEQHRPKKEEDDEVEFIENINFKIEDMKFSEDEKMIVLVTKDTVKIYNVEENKRILNDVLKYNEITTVEFYDNSNNQIILGALNQIIIYDWIRKLELKKISIISRPIQLTYATPFLIIGQKNTSILILNLRTEQGYRYIKNTKYLNNEIFFVANKNKFDCIVAYFSSDGKYLILDSLHMQFLSYIQIKNMTIMTDQQTLDLIQPNPIPLNVSLFQNYQSHTQIFVAISKDSNLIAISPYTDSQKIYVFEYLNGSLKLLYRLYRGKSQKQINLVFLSNKVLGCLSLQNNINVQNDATLHLFYNFHHDQQDQESLIRIYFKTQSDKETKSKRIKQTLINMQGNKIQVFSGNNFHFSEDLIQNGQFQSNTIQDAQKSTYWF